MKIISNMFIAIVVISIIAYFGVEGRAMLGGARGFQQDDVPQDVPQEFNPRIRRAPEDQPPEEVPQEIEHHERARRSPNKMANAAQEEVQQGLHMHGGRYRRSPQMPGPGDMPPMPPMPPVPQGVQ